MTTDMAETMEAAPFWAVKDLRAEESLHYRWVTMAMPGYGLKLPKRVQQTTGGRSLMIVVVRYFWGSRTSSAKGNWTYLGTDIASVIKS